MDSSSAGENKYGKSVAYQENLAFKAKTSKTVKVKYENKRIHNPRGDTE